MQKKFYFKLLTALFILIVAGMLARISIAGVDNKGATIAWSYSGKVGPQYWGQLSKDFSLCATGKKQSPIDIVGYLPAQKDSLQFNYKRAPLNIIDDGLTQINIEGKPIIFNDGHTVQLNFPANEAREVISYQGQSYRLVQLHFHAPSENLLNGVAFPLEIHLVHQGSEGKVLVVGVFVQPGAANPMFDTIIAHLPKEHNITYTVKNAAVNPTQLIPFNHSYYQFAGSLTTPPCAEGVKWMVMEKPITASLAQIKELTAAIGPSNARPIQPLNNRQIEHVVY